MRSVRLLIVGVFSAAAALHAADIDAYLKGLQLFGEKRYDEALTRLEGVIRDDPSFTRAYARIAAIHAAIGQPEEARKFFENLASAGTNPYAGYALALWHRENKQPGVAEHHARLALEKTPDMLLAYKELVDAGAQGRELQRVETVLTEWTATPARAAGAWFGLAYLARVRKQWDSVLDHLDAAERTAPGTWEIASLRFTAYYQSDRHREALAVLQRMHELGAAASDREREAYARGQMGLIRSELGEYAEAIPHLEHAVAWAQEIGDRRLEQSHRGQLGLVYIYLALYPRAIEECRTAVRLAEELGLRMAHERNLALVARIYEETANYPKALETFEEAIRIAREVSDRAGEADHLARLSSVLAAMGEPEKGLSAAARGLEIARQIGNPWLEGRLLETQGLLLRSVRRHGEALSTLQRGIEIAKRIGDRLGEATRLVLAAAVHAETNNAAAALQSYQQALEMATEARAWILEGDIRNGLGKVYLGRGDLDQAEENFRQALEAGRETQMLEVVWRAHAGLAGTREKGGLTADACEEYREAIRAIEQVRGRFPMAENRAGFLEDKIDIYRRLVRLLAASKSAEAFHYAERARARSFLDALAERTVHSSDRPEPVLHARMQSAEARLSALQAGLIAQYARPAKDAAAIKRLNAELNQADEEYFQLRREVRSANPFYAAFRYPEPASLREAQALIGSGLLLSYWLDAGQSYLFAVTHNSYRVFRMPAQGIIEARVRRLRKAISAPARSAWPNYVVEARALYRDLVAPAAHLLAGKQDVVIVPDGALHYLPFELLLRGAAAGAADLRELPYLGRDYGIRYVPSASVLAALKNRPVRSPRKWLLAYGDPLYGAGRSEANAVRSALLEQVSEGFTRLPESRREVESIRRVYGRENATVFTGAETSEENVKAGSLSDYRVLHFAVHAITDESQPQFSGLVLGQPRGTGQDGLLQAYEISQLALNADLVVLSACETGTGRRMNGEGLVSLTRAFMAAGALSVVGSLWKVQDRSTTELMIRFYRHLRDGRWTTAQALQLARRELIDEGIFAHPYYWAPFVLFGDSVAPGK